MNKKYEVSVVKCNNYENKNVRMALEESFKNINFEFKKNLTVLIKPNLLSANLPEKGITTHPTVIEELCKILKRFNAKIYIGDSSAHDTEKSLEVCGIKKLSKYAKVINFEKTEKKFLNLGKKTTRVPVSEILFDVDLVINVAKMKTHGLTNATLCVKNLYGCVIGNSKEYYHKILNSKKEFSKLLVSLHDKIKPQLNIIDGVIGLEGEGPGPSGKLVKPGLIFASKNAYAIDIVCSETMGFKLNGVPTNKLSGLKRKEIEVFGNGQNVKLKFQKPIGYYLSPLIYFSKFIPTLRISFDKEKCVKCRLCFKKCPVNAISMKPYPECEHKKCVQCLCCIEVCPHSAVYLKEPWIRSTLKKIAKRAI